MNLPVGEIIEENLALDELDVRGLISALVEKQFTGYIVNTVGGTAGIEEGVLLFKHGILVGSFYDYSNYGVIVFGKDAVAFVFNSFAAQKGVVDIMSLSTQQADLITAFNDRLKLTITFKKSDLLGLIRANYDSGFAQKALANVVDNGETRKNVMKRLGLSELW